MYQLFTVKIEFTCRLGKSNLSFRLSFVAASINVADGSFNISGNGVEGEGTFTVANGTAEIGLHMVVGQMAQNQEVVIAADKATTVNSLKTTSQSDHTETEVILTKEGKWVL